MNKGRERADKALVTRGFFESRTAARAAIEAGGVTADGVAITRASQMLPGAATISASPAHPYVSRGGLKLAHGLKTFGVDPAGRTCLDLGASTGGFTDVLLQSGARHVVAIDVGQDQLHPRLREDQRVSVFEGQDARAVTREHLGADTSLIVTDLSFIGLEKALGTVLALAPPGCQLIGLFKPQFQVGRSFVGKGGLVTDKGATARATEVFKVWMEGVGWPIRGWTASPITGGDGNNEALFHTGNAII